MVKLSDNAPSLNTDKLVTKSDGGTMACENGKANAAACAAYCATEDGCRGFYYYIVDLYGPGRCCPKSEWEWDEFDREINDSSGNPAGEFYSYIQQKTTVKLSSDHPATSTQPFKSDGTDFGCVNLPTGNRGVGVCAEYCDTNVDCKGFWYYTNGRCCPKATWSFAATTARPTGQYSISGGDGFYSYLATPLSCETYTTYTNPSADS